MSEFKTCPKSILKQTGNMELALFGQQHNPLGTYRGKTLFEQAKSQKHPNNY